MPKYCFLAAEQFKRWSFWTPQSFDRRTTENQMKRVLQPALIHPKR